MPLDTTDLQSVLRTFREPTASPAGSVDADAVKMQHRGLIDFNALKGPTLDHDNILKKLI